MLRIGLVLSLLWLTGCGGAPEVNYVPPPTEEYLNTLAGAYMKFTTANKRPPKNADELLPVLKEWGEPADKFLSSPRDFEPFVVVWGFDFRTAKTGADGNPPFFAYEKIGAKGRRFASNFRGSRELSPDEFVNSLFPPGHTPAP